MNYFALYKLLASSLIGVVMYIGGLATNPVRFNQTPGPNDPIYKEGMIYAPILMYHHVAPKIGDNPYFVSPDIFEQQMAWLNDNDYNVISLQQFYDGVYGNHLLPEKPVVLTFDDGNRDQYVNAFPVMKKYGYTGTFYVITNNLDLRGYFSWDMLKEMVADGMDIQSHTVHHPSLGTLDEAQNEYELSKSKEVLENKLGISIKHLAYPGGSYSKTTMDVLERLGYLTATTVQHTQYHSTDTNPYKIGRMHIDSDMESFVGFVTGRRKD